MAAPTYTQVSETMWSWKCNTPVEKIVNGKKVKVRCNGSGLASSEEKAAQEWRLHTHA